MDVNNLVQNAMGLIGAAALIISALAFMTSLFVELVKSAVPTENTPLQLVTYIVGIIVTEVSLLVANGSGYLGTRWYYYVIGFFVGLMVAQVAMNGWDNLKAIWTKVKHESVECNKKGTK